jgi:ATP-dependent Clp protease ATP-binding subunit ClpA
MADRSQADDWRGFMFERFSADARQAVIAAQHESLRAGHESVGCEHLLLALVTDRRGIAGQAAAAAGLDSDALRARIAARADPGSEPLDAEALALLGIDLDSVRRAAEAAFGPGALNRGARGRPGPARPFGGGGLTKELKKSVELALRSAISMRDRQISPGHLLIGIIDQGDNAALRALAGAGIDPGALRLDVLARITAAA